MNDWDNKEEKRAETRKEVFRSRSWLMLNSSVKDSEVFDAKHSAETCIEMYSDWIFK